MDPGWQTALAPVAETIAAVDAFVAGERARGRTVLPAEHQVMRAFEAPFDAVRVLIVGQDPYPTPGHPIGLAFGVDRSVRPLPRSLANLYRELHDDLGIAPAAHGDLSALSQQGVLLLNRVLTVDADAHPAAGSHRRRGWEAVTDRAINALVQRGGPLVAILWGNDARALAPMLGDVPIIASAHPSPLSASRGFFGSRPFSRANEALIAQGSSAIDWRLDDDALFG